MPKRKIDWVNSLFLIATHLLALVAIIYMAAVHFSWWTIGLGFCWAVFCGVSITGGYHRLFAHPTYKARWFLRAFYLAFGAASVQNSALKWSADHRIHHNRTDTDQDPYNIRRGFLWAHMGWIFFKDGRDIDLNSVRDLAADPLIQFQHRHYVLLAVIFGAILPACLGLLWSDAIGALLVAGALRLVLQWHATFSVNSFAHLLGSQPYSTKNSARDSFITALITLGEGYHNFHHRFQSDYRNGVRWFHFDPTKWFVWSLSKVRITSDLKRVPAKLIERAREAAQARTPATPGA